jgi:hypothetical protein
MRRIFLASLILGLSGCAATTPKVDVTRFNIGQPVDKSSIAVQPADPARSDSLAWQAEARAVSDALGLIGFTPAQSLASARLVAVAELVQVARDVGPATSPFSIGLGGGTGGGGFGIGGGITLPIGKKRANQVIGSELQLRIRRQADGVVLWEGRARTEAKPGTPYAEPATVTRRLADAMLKDFPGRSGETITVK